MSCIRYRSLGQLELLFYRLFTAPHILELLAEAFACSSVFSSSMSATATTTHASIGRGNPSSLPCRRVSTDRLSIVDRLAARSVTGRSLQILVHQHYGYRLHLEWRRCSGSRDSSRFMERRFYMQGEAETFFTELCSRGLEGLCTCVYEGYNMSPHERAPTCLRAPLIQSKKYLSEPKWWLKALQDMSIKTHCGCNIPSSSSDPLEWT